jgi:hypothetical protein
MEVIFKIIIMKEKHDISIHFQTKTNTISEIEKKFRNWCEGENYNGIFDERETETREGTFETRYIEPRTTLHHCFLREQELKKLNLPSDKVSVIESTFDFLCRLCEDIVQWKGVSVYEDALCLDRQYMLENIKKCNGVALFIGEIIDGVKEEYVKAKELGVDIVLIPKLVCKTKSALAFSFTT